MMVLMKDVVFGHSADHSYSLSLYFVNCFKLGLNMRSIWWIPAIFVSYVLLLYVLSMAVYVHADKNTNWRPGFPSTVADLKVFAVQMNLVIDQHFALIMTLFCVAYLFKQTFAIPGSVALNVLSGHIFGGWLGTFIVSFLSACGASCCFLLSRHFAKDHVMRYCGKRLSTIKRLIDQEKHDNQFALFTTLLSMRLFPMSPNWLINLSCPVLGVPLRLFFPSVLIGLIPYNMVCAQAGAMLNKLHDFNELLTLRTALVFCSLALVALAPQIFVRFYKRDKLSHDVNGYIAPIYQHRT